MAVLTAAAALDAGVLINLLRRGRDISVQKAAADYDTEEPDITEDAEKSPSRIVTDSDVVRIYTAGDSFDADQILAAFREHQIPAYSKDLGTGQLMKIYFGTSMQGTEIYVPKSCGKRAAELLAEMGYLEEG